MATKFEQLLNYTKDHESQSPAPKIMQDLMTIGDQIDEIMRQQQLRPTKDRQAALATISRKVRELRDAVETAHMLP
jgi:hypothetical protein